MLKMQTAFKGEKKKEKDCYKRKTKKIELHSDNMSV